MKKLWVLAILALLGLGTGSVRADSIYVIHQFDSHSMVTNALNYLTNLGHTVTQGNTLANYSAYGQVWDLRYSTNLNAGDVAAMGSYLQGGGRMYLTGEWDAFDGVRNNSLLSWVTGVGAGTLSNGGGAFSGNQAITAAGQVVNSPNNFASVSYGAALNVGVVASQGFLVTSNNGTSGSLVGWDFGDITGANGARMLIGFDIEIFNSQNGQGWTQNMATYLGADAIQEVPTPAGIVMTGIAGLCLFVCNRLRRRKASLAS